MAIYCPSYREGRRFYDTKSSSLFFPWGLKDHHSGCIPMLQQWFAIHKKKKTKQNTEVHSLRLYVRQHNRPVTRSAKSPQLPLSTDTGITMLSTLLTLEPMCCTENTGYLAYSDRREEKGNPEKRAVPSEDTTDEVEILHIISFKRNQLYLSKLH